jgi:predicted ArsR family transcriptional regulator
VEHYGLVGELLVDALAQATPDEAPLATATRIATARGKRLGTHVRLTRALGRLGPERTLTVASELLEQYGYEPQRSSRRTTLRLDNCPFRTLAGRAPEIVCAINQALLDGLLRGLGDQRVQAVLAPRPNACCVELHAPGTPR